MANTFVTPSAVAAIGTEILHNELVMANLVYRDYESELTSEKVGDTITIRSPATFTANEFSTTISTQDATEGSVQLVVEKHFDTSVALTQKEKTLSLDRYVERILRPAMISIAEAVDSYLHGKYKEIFNVVGTSGDAPDSIADLAAIVKALDDQKVSGRMRRAIVNPAAKADMLTIPGVHEADKRGDGGTALRDASMGSIMGIDWHMAQGVPTHTSGTAATGAGRAVNGAATAGDTTIDIDGGTGSETYVVGDVIQIAGEGSHVVTAAATATSGAVTSLAITPALRANVADDTAVTVPATGTVGLAFDPTAIALALIAPVAPGGNVDTSVVNYQGVSMRVVEDYDINTKKNVISFDVMAAAKVIHPEKAVRILG